LPFLDDRVHAEQADAGKEYWHEDKQAKERRKGGDKQARDGRAEINIDLGENAVRH